MGPVRVTLVEAVRAASQDTPVETLTHTELPIFTDDCTLGATRQSKRSAGQWTAARNLYPANS
jgi:hypothetical protein